jgi:hypothetical protein
VGQRDFRLDPFEAVAVKLELTEKGGRKGKGMDGGTDIVDESGKRELCRANTAADGFPGFHQKDGSEFSFQRDGRSQPVGPRAHNDGIVMISTEGQIPATSCETAQIELKKIPLDPP